MRHTNDDGNNILNIHMHQTYKYLTHCQDMPRDTAGHDQDQKMLV